MHVACGPHVAHEADQAVIHLTHIELEPGRAHPMMETMPEHHVIWILLWRLW